MAKNDIAPMLQEFVADLPFTDVTPEEDRALRAELKALLRIARTAKKYYVYVNEYSDPIPEIDGPLRRALESLDRASKRSHK